MPIFQYPALQDNYNWIVSCEQTGECVGVDIYDVIPFFDYIEKNNLKLMAILNTHHHHDHTGGNNKIAEKYPNIKFYGSEYDYKNKRIDQQTDGLKENDKIKFGNIELNVLEIPGHTLGHICYFNSDMAFVGDTIFASGCGRLFEGSPEQMLHSLKKIINNLENKTKIYCGHEYTLSNLKFSQSLNNQYFSEYKSDIESKRKNNIMTVPTDINKELAYNPFIMVTSNKLKNEVLKLENMNELEAFTYLRKLKDSF